MLRASVAVFLQVHIVSFMVILVMTRVQPAAPRNKRRLVAAAVYRYSRGITGPFLSDVTASANVESTDGPTYLTTVEYRSHRPLSAFVAHGHVYLLQSLRLQFIIYVRVFEIVFAIA